MVGPPQRATKVEKKRAGRLVETEKFTQVPRTERDRRKVQGDLNTQTGFVELLDCNARFCERT